MSRRLLLPLVLLALLLVASGSWLGHRLLTQAITHLLAQQALQLADTVKNAARLGSDWRSLDRFVQAEAGNPDVQEITVVYGTPPRVVAANDAALLGKSPDDLPEAVQLRRALDAGAISFDYGHTSNYFIEVTAPFALDATARLHGGGDGKGVICVELRTSAVWQLLHRNAWIMGGFATTAVLLLVAMAMALVQKLVVTRLQDIEQTIAQQASGDAHARAQAQPADEIGRLGGTLNYLFTTVASNSAELQESAAHLARARDAAEAANNAKARFLANMSHEIRTPMNGILGSLHVLESGGLNEEQRVLVDIARESSARMLKLLNELLELANDDRGHAAPASVAAELALPALAEEFLARNAGRCKAAGAELSFVLGADVPASVHAAAGALAATLDRMLTSALAAADADALVLEITRPEPTVLRFEIGSGAAATADDVAHRRNYISFSLPLEADAAAAAPAAIQALRDPPRIAPPAPQAQGGAPASLVDPKRVREVQAMLGAGWYDLVQAFFDDAAVEIEQMQGALRTTDRGALRRHAHALKGAAGSVGASGFSSLCLELETGCAQMPEEQLNALVGNVCARYADLRDLLQAVPA
ncbi:MAG: Hpt domain-containing protein [Rhodocyclaceae bacterium]|nr:Hpt domain-containing protein [Rhodocyclaceae bacterium]MBX3669508.1 Hpt domain-containing protein [Rhodocyclaceae bacterium]